jgi:GNAT superfamily N-acetyltransferase
VEPAEFAPPCGRFLVAYADGAPVACGGWRARDGGHPELRSGDAELKRMYVDPVCRGHGRGRLLLAHLEETARAAGRRRMVLESGLRQPAALAFYAACGYVPMPPFGTYRDEPGTRCFARHLRG